MLEAVFSRETGGWKEVTQRAWADAGSIARVKHSKYDVWMSALTASASSRRFTPTGKRSEDGGRLTWYHIDTALRKSTFCGRKTARRKARSRRTAWHHVSDAELRYSDRSICTAYTGGKKRGKADDSDLAEREDRLGRTGKKTASGNDRKPDFVNEKNLK